MKQIVPGDLVYYVSAPSLPWVWEDGELGIYIGPSDKYPGKHIILWSDNETSPDPISHEATSFLKEMRKNFLDLMAKTV